MSHCCDVTVSESVICKTQQQTQLASTRITNQDQFKEVVIITFKSHPGACVHATSKRLVFIDGLAAHILRTLVTWRGCWPSPSLISDGATVSSVRRWPTFGRKLWRRVWVKRLTSVCVFSPRTNELFQVRGEMLRWLQTARRSLTLRRTYKFLSFSEV